MKEITKAYKCDYCGRIFATKSGTANHERCCRKNPANIACCRYCKYLTMDVEEGTFEHPKKTVFHCTKKGVNLYHPKIKRKPEWIRSAIIDGQGAEVMPTLDNKCEFCDTDIYADFEF